MAYNGLDNGQPPYYKHKEQTGNIMIRVSFEMFYRGWMNTLSNPYSIISICYCTGALGNLRKPMETIHILISSLATCRFSFSCRGSTPARSSLGYLFWREVRTQTYTYIHRIYIYHTLGRYLFPP